MSTAGHEAAANAPTAGEYIVHHLTHWNSTGHAQKDVIDFSVINVDTMIFSVLMGVIGLFVMWRVAKSVTSGVPGRMQAAIEIVLEMVNDQAKGIVHSAESRKFVGPLALTVFIWIFLMNSMDFLPLDLLPTIWQAITGDHHAYLRVVPTADLNGTLGMSLGVLLVCLYYIVRLEVDHIAWLGLHGLRMEPWFGIESIAAGIWGVGAGMLVILCVSLLTPPPSREIQDFVESVRYPAL